MQIDEETMGRSLSKPQLDQLHGALLQRREQLLDQLLHLPDPHELVDAELLRLAARELGQEPSALTVIDGERQYRRETQIEITLVEQALARLAAGRYGSCVVCGEPIAFGRLREQSALLRCATCRCGADAAQNGPE